MVRGTTNSIAKLSMAPRITVWAGLDTEGEVYLSLLQSNSNNSVMEIFLRKLVLKLQRDDKDWRENTVILLDNASYHTSDSSVDLLGGLDIPVIFTGPYSYDGAPIELLFAAIKTDDINPELLKMGKG